MTITRDDVIRWLNEYGQNLAENKDYLTPTGFGHRRRRSWREHGSRLQGGTGQAAHRG